MKEYSQYLEKVKGFLADNDAKLIAHYYVDESIQRIAEDTGGIVSDSLEMARFGNKQKESKLIVAGVRFMGETAKILNPDKRIIGIANPTVPFTKPARKPIPKLIRRNSGFC